jgi:hypothetical protein
MNAPAETNMTLEARLRRWLAPRVFFLGIALSFAACCVTGRQLVKLLTFRDYQFLTEYLNPLSQYRPTALQIRTLARRQLPREKIAVIIGGNSVLQQSGGPRSQPWTRYLEQELGDDYRLLNVAAPGAAPNQFGELAAEMLIGDHPRIIHVCNCWSTGFPNSPDGAAQYRYSFLDARARGLLLEAPERDAALAALKPMRRARENGLEEELEAWTNRLLSFNDLWHLVGYEAFFTIWSPECALGPFRARKRWIVDGALDGKLMQDWPQHRRLLLGRAQPWTPGDDASLRAHVRQAIPAPLRAKTFMAVNRSCPAYLRRLEAEQPGFLAGYDRRLHDVVTGLRHEGLDAMPVGITMADDDFRDSVHLTASGGEKLAKELAPAIRDLARRLGYIAGGEP